MIHTEKLTKTFTVKKETVEAVKGVDIDVAPGELVAFLGPNGAGKSTTLRMLTTLLRPTSGSATVAGVDVGKDPAGVRARIGYIGQGNGGGHSYRVIDELIMQGRFYGMNTTDAKARAETLMASLDLSRPRQAHGDQAFRRATTPHGRGTWVDALPRLAVPGRALHGHGSAKPRQPLGAHSCGCARNTAPPSC